MARAYTEEEVRSMVLDQIRATARYWAQLPNKTAQERCDGVAFSILSLLDGVTDLPAMSVSLAPHPEDKAYHQENGENWFEPGQVVNNVFLHEYYVKPQRKQ